MSSDLDEIFIEAAFGLALHAGRKLVGKRFVIGFPGMSLIFSKNACVLDERTAPLRSSDLFEELKESKKNYFQRIFENIEFFENK